MAWKEGPGGTWQSFFWKESGWGTFFLWCFWIFVGLMILGWITG